MLWFAMNGGGPGVLVNFGIQTGQAATIWQPSVRSLLGLGVDFDKEGVHIPKVFVCIFIYVHNVCTRV